jgi:ribosomal protein S18 acetylase RimI-like enzyme
VNPAVEIREATAMDAHAIAAVHVETWRAAYAGVVPDRYLVGLSEAKQERYWREAIGRQRAGRVLVALAESAAGERSLVGFGSCGPARDASLGYPGEVFTLYVTPDWQNQGIGRRLLTGLLEELAASGRASAYLWVLAANPTRFFYQALGGQAVAEREELFAGARLPEIAYAWPDLVGWLKAVTSSGDQ